MIVVTYQTTQVLEQNRIEYYEINEYQHRAAFKNKSNIKLLFHEDDASVWKSIGEPTDLAEHLKSCSWSIGAIFLWIEYRGNHSILQL